MKKTVLLVVSMFSLAAMLHAGEWFSYCEGGYDDDGGCSASGDCNSVWNSRGSCIAGVYGCGGAGGSSTLTEVDGSCYYYIDTGVWRCEPGTTSTTTGTADC